MRIKRKMVKGFVIIINIKIIVFIEVNEQCDLYPGVFTWLADKSGKTIHISEAAEAIAPAIKIC